MQGPTPEKKSEDVIPLVTKYHPQLQFNEVTKTITLLFKNIKDQDTKKKFLNSKPILSFKQPANITSLLTSAKFVSNPTTSVKQMPGIFLCNRKICKLCSLYLQSGKTFQTSNGTTWDIRCHITCKSKSVVYFLSCNCCNGQTTYIGQTTNFRQRMNNHISESRNGVSSCIFPQHVHKCGTLNKNLQEPFFKINVFMELKDPKLLTQYEEKLFRAGHAVLN